MGNFKDFKIVPPAQNFRGDKIDISRILNCPIVVNAFKIVDSILEKKKGNGKCLYLSIIFEDKERIVFSGSVILQKMILDVPNEGGFPFTTKIIESDRRLIFT